MSNAVERVRQRLLRVARILEEAEIPYAVVGGNAVAAWVSRVDEAAVRNTRDVDILLRRTDLKRARHALERMGFVYRYAAGIDMFLDGPGAKGSDAVHVVFAGERLRPEYVEAAPDMSESEPSAEFQLLSLDALVRMTLTSFRDRDRVHLRDMIDVGLVDPSWSERVPQALRSRLLTILNDPDG